MSRVALLTKDVEELKVAIGARMAYLHSLKSRRFDWNRSVEGFCG